MSTLAKYLPFAVPLSTISALRLEGEGAVKRALQRTTA